MHVIELRDPQVLMKADLQQLLKRAVESGTFLAPQGVESVAEDIFNFVVRDDQFMFLGAEKGQWKGVIMGYLPAGHMFPYPTIVNFYNEGSRALSREMGAALMDFIVERGYTQVLAVNSSGHSDEVWLKGLTPTGAKSYITGSLSMFEVE